jgi:ketosteroid isomerase-like protein
MGQLEEDNKALARRMIEALSNVDVGFIEENYADDFRIWVTGSLPFSGSRDKAGAVAGMPAVLDLFPDGLRFEIVALTAEGERVAIEARSEGVTARGHRYQQEYHFLMRVRDGRIVEWREYMDTEHARKVLVDGVDEH